VLSFGVSEDGDFLFEKDIADTLIVIEMIALPVVFYDLGKKTGIKKFN